MHREKKNGTWKRVGDFLSGKGFYIILFLCMAAIGVSGFFLITGDLEEDGKAVAGNVRVTVSPSSNPTLTPVLPSLSPKPTQTPAPANPSPTPALPPVSPSKKTDSGAETSGVGEGDPDSGAANLLENPGFEAENGTKTVENVFTWPVNGTILSDFSLEVVAYDETMADWRTHQGIDISSQLGSKVMATADGVVSSVFFDQLMGETVVISHEGDLQSVYSNLALTPTVAVGDSVTTGQIIGSVGETAIAEGAKATHLHFEMMEDGELVDPVSYLPEK